MQKIIARIAIFHQRAAISVSAIIANMTIVAMMRVSWNILFSCLHGPIKKHVLKVLKIKIDAEDTPVIGRIN
jgi:hypothetical protein